MKPNFLVIGVIVAAVAAAIWYFYVRCACKNGGTCSKTGCTCPAGFSGSDCGTPVTSSAPVPANQCPACVNGTCNPSSGTCTCAPGWSGSTCNVASTPSNPPPSPFVPPPAPPAPVNPCASGCANGTCTSTGCQCYPGWIGATCSIPVQSPPPPAPYVPPYTPPAPAPAPYVPPYVPPAPAPPAQAPAPYVPPAPAPPAQAPAPYVPPYTPPTPPAPSVVTVKSNQCGTFMSSTNSSSSLAASGTKFTAVYSTKNSSRFQLYQTVGASYQVLGSSNYSANAPVSLYGPPASGVFTWWSIAGPFITLCVDDAYGQHQSGALCLNVTGGQCGAGTEVHLYTPNDASNQANYFSLVPS